MKTFSIVAVFMAFFTGAKAQKVDSIFFHLYTDSLKKGTYNYINVDGKLGNGRWLPLTSKEIIFTASAGTFEGNSLFVAKDQPDQRVTIKAVLKADTSVAIQTILYIKKNGNTEALRTEADIIRSPQKRRKQLSRSE
ncbi:MAG: hypothetical protein ABJB86_23940 [Bacteroidota bacterium]